MLARVIADTRAAFERLVKGRKIHALVDTEGLPKGRLMAERMRIANARKSKVRSKVVFAHQKELIGLFVMRSKNEECRTNRQHEENERGSHEKRETEDDNIDDCLN